MNTSQEVIPITPQQPRPLTGDDLWKPWPEYTRLFQDHPERAASVARELFSTADLTYLPFIRSFPWDQDFRQLDEALHSSDFLIALLDFVSNDFWYAQLREIAGPERVAKESWAAIQLYYTLRCIGRLILTDKGKVERPKSPELCERCLQRFPRLWKLLWEDKDIIFYHEFAGTVARDSDIFSVVRYLVECHFFMAQQFNYGDSPSIASYTAHIAFLLWHNSGDRKYQARVASRMVVGMFEERFDPWEDNIPAFAREVVPAVIGQQDPMEVFFNALPTEGKDMLEATHLYNTLKMSLIVFHGCRSQLTMSDETRRKALYTLARLFHRYQCHGDMIHVPVTFQRISMMTLGCFYFIYKYDEGNVPKDIVTDPCNLDFMSVVISAVVHVFTVQRERSLLESSMLVPMVLTRYGNQARNAINPAFRRNWAHIRRILQPRWQPILEELRLAFQSSQRTRNEDPKHTAQLRDICKVWQELGACYNLNSHSRERDSLQSLISYVTPAERLQGCFMTECPCYGRKSPWHKTRRVCRGCWAAYYCNKQCQKRDWELGHKEVCPGRH